MVGADTQHSALKDPREFVKVHVGLPDHPKIEPLSDGAFRLLITLWCYCREHRTDGRITASAWAKRGTPKARKELIAAGLMILHPDGSLEARDFLKHQQSAAEITAATVAKQKAGAKGNHARWHVAGKTDPACEFCLASHTDRSRDASATPTSDRTLDSQEEEQEEDKKSSTRKRGSRLPEGWKPTAEDVAWARSEKITDFVQRRETEKFVDYWRAIAGGKGVKLDWSLTWRNWLRRVIDDKPQAKATGSTFGGW